MVLGIACLLLPGEGSVNLFIYSCLLNDKFVIPCLFHVIRKISMVGCRITFGLRPHVIRHPTIDIFPYYVNKQGITNSIRLMPTFSRQNPSVLEDLYQETIIVHSQVFWKTCTKKQSLCIATDCLSPPCLTNSFFDLFWKNGILSVLSEVAMMSVQSVGFKNNFKLFNNTHVFEPNILEKPFSVLSGWYLNCSWLIHIQNSHWQCP